MPLPVSSLLLVSALAVGFGALALDFSGPGCIACNGPIAQRQVRGGRGRPHDGPYHDFPFRCEELVSV
jgi:hypothetical protein